MLSRKSASEKVIIFLRPLEPQEVQLILHTLDSGDDAGHSGDSEDDAAAVGDSQYPKVELPFVSCARLLAPELQSSSQAFRITRWKGSANTACPSVFSIQEALLP